MYEDINQSWKATIRKKASGDYEEVPDGDYTVWTEKVTLRKSKAGNPMLSWQLRIMNGEHEGRCLFKNSMAATPKNIVYFVDDLQSAGMTEEYLETVDKLIYEDDFGNLATDLDLNKLLEQALAVRKSTNDGGFASVYLNDHLGHRDQQSAPVAEGHKTFDDEDILF